MAALLQLDYWKVYMFSFILRIVIAIARTGKKKEKKNVHDINIHEKYVREETA